MKGARTVLFRSAPPSFVSTRPPQKQNARPRASIRPSEAGVAFQDKGSV